MKLGSVKLLGGVAILVLLAGVVPPGGLLSPPQAQAQTIGQRVVVGTVIDAGSTPVAGATVFLKDLKTKVVRSYSSDAKGRFRFTQVDMAEDHEIWGESNGKKSPVKTVSEWDSRKELEVELKLK